MTAGKVAHSGVWLISWLAGLPLALVAVFSTISALLTGLVRLSPGLDHYSSAVALVWLILPLAGWTLMVVTRWGAWLWAGWWGLLACWVFADTIATASMQLSGGLNRAALAADAPWASALLAAALLVGVCVLQFWVAAEAPMRKRAQWHADSAPGLKLRLVIAAVAAALILAAWLAVTPPLAIAVGIVICLIWTMAEAAMLVGDVSGPVLPPHHRRAAVIVPIAIVPLLAVGLVLAWGAPMPFDADRWNGEGTGRQSHERFSWGDNTRARMLDDLLATHLHAGMRPAETEALLGQYDHNQWHSFEILPRPALSHVLLACGRWWWPIPNLQLEFTGHRNRPGRLIEARVIKYFD